MNRKKILIVHSEEENENKPEIKVFPTTGLPMVADLNLFPWASTFQRNSLKKGRKKKKTLRDRLSTIVAFSTATLGRNLGLNDTLAERARLRALAWSAEVYRRKSSAEPKQQHISSASMVYLRESFRVQCYKGQLKKPVIHVEFDYPKSFTACCKCSSTDFLYVYVGLFNVFIIQIIVVVLMFFSEKEIDLSNVEEYYQPKNVNLFL